MKPTLEEVIRNGLLNPTYEHVSDTVKSNTSSPSNTGNHRVHIVDTKKTAELQLVNGMTSYKDIIKAASSAGLDVEEVISQLDKFMNEDGTILKSDLSEILNN